MKKLLLSIIGLAAMAPAYAAYEGLVSNMNDWTFEGTQNIAAWADNYGMKITAYNTETPIADVYAVSPEISIAANDVASFEWVGNFFSGNDPKNFIGVAVRENGGAWTALNVPTWFAGNNWTFVNSGDINLASYAGKKVQFGFHYTSTEAVSSTLEVKNFKVAEKEVVNKKDLYTVDDILEMDVNSDIKDAKIEGYIVGWIEGSKYNAESVHFNAVANGEVAVSATNLVLASASMEDDYTYCIPVQLPIGAVRTALNLQDNPDNLGKKVVLTGEIVKFFGVMGVKGVSAYEIEGGGSTVDPNPGVKVAYEKVSAIESGKAYAIVTNGFAAVNLGETYNYGYLKPVVEVAVADVFETASEIVPFTFTSTDGGWYIKDIYNRYYYQTGEYNSFNVSVDLPEEGAVWTVDFTAEGVKITNILKGKTIQYDEGYGSYGCYAEITHALPSIYVQKEAAVEVVESSDAPVEYFNLQGVRVANPEKGLYIVRQGSKAKKVMM